MLFLADLRSTLEVFLNLFIQSETSASTHEYSESNRASKYVMLHSDFGDEHRRLSPISDGDFVINWFLFPRLIKKARQGLITFSLKQFQL